MAFKGTGTFTVKHIDNDTGRWRLLAAASVSYDEQTHTLTLMQMVRPCPKCGCDDIIEHITSGHAYVMNDSGKTVSAYNLDKKEQQHGTGTEGTATH